MKANNWIMDDGHNFIIFQMEKEEPMDYIIITRKIKWAMGYPVKKIWPSGNYTNFLGENGKVYTVSTKYYTELRHFLYVLAGQRGPFSAFVGQTPRSPVLMCVDGKFRKHCALLTVYV